jgi:transcriptional regulator with XRE-family HTH domain
MMNLTFGEQVKVILKRKGMTIKELAERVEEHTGKPMSRQNMTQRLGRDNFQEQDMRMIAEILGCQFTLSIMEPEEMEVQEQPVEEPKKEISEFFRKPASGEVKENLGQMNPYTRKEYETNSVRTHPTKIGYVQVYDQELHRWTDMTEWAFLGFQERKKKLLGNDYKPPIYLD